MREVNIDEGLESDVPKNIPINEFTEIIPGMLIRKKGMNSYTPYRVMYAEPNRDGFVTCLDEFGHSAFVPAWNGEFEIVSEGFPKMRIAYGKSPTSNIHVSKSYYWDEEDFKRKHSLSSFWYVEALKGTKRFIPVKTEIEEK